MKVIVLSGNKLEERNIENNLETLQEIVDGYIETPMISEILRDNDIIPVINEEGKFIEGLKPEIAICDRSGMILDMVFGNIIFVGFDGVEDFTDLTDKQVRTIKSELKQFAIVGEKIVRVLYYN